MSFLNSLDKLRPNGRNKWRACCPVHQGNNPTALSIKQNSDGSYVMNCHNCGANGVDVFDALCINKDELFGSKSYERPAISSLMQEQAREDKMCLAIYKSARERGDTITLKDHQRHKLAVNRLQGIERLGG